MTCADTQVLWTKEPAGSAILPDAEVRPQVPAPFPTTQLQMCSAVRLRDRTKLFGTEWDGHLSFRKVWNSGSIPLQQGYQFSWLDDDLVISFRGRLELIGDSILLAMDKIASIVHGSSSGGSIPHIKQAYRYYWTFNTTFEISKQRLRYVHESLLGAM
jgi:hypothetical protein